MNFPIIHEKNFLDGGGELGALMRAHDWTQTPLGSPADWPRSLKTAVRIMLTSRQPIWLGWGPELTYLYNDAYKSIIGGKHPSALGRPFSEVWKEIWDVVGPMADAVMTRDEGTYVEAQLLIMQRHGYQEETYYTFSYSPVPNDDGGPGGLICANTDDTRRVIGERQLALLSDLAAKMGGARSRADVSSLALCALASNQLDIPFAVFFTSTYDKTEWLNAGATAGCESLMHPGLWPCSEVMSVGQLRVVTLDHAYGSLPTGPWPNAPAHAAVLPIASSTDSGASAVLVIGLNPFRKFDDNYRDFVTLVARQVSAGFANAHAYEEEKKRAESLAELDRAKTVFFSNVSHELRTPLTLMLGPIEEMLARQRETSAGAPDEILTTIHRNGQRLLKLVNTLLDFSRIEAGRAQAAFELTDVATLTAELASNFRSACQSAGLALNIDCAVPVEDAYIDREMWEKIILNLLSNAFKFTLEGSIGVRVRDRGATIEASVVDTGVGIPASALARTFERFHRIEGSGGRSHEGSGIGLALVNELVKLHGGTISVSSELGKGTTFAVSIPKGCTHLPQEHVKPADRAISVSNRADTYVVEALSWLPDVTASHAPVRRQGIHRVLVADDNADLRAYVRRLLNDYYEVEVVADGEAALVAARAHRPDIVVSDVMMPRLDGFGLIKALRADRTLSAIPVILLSARAGEEARLEGLGKGADDYLVKPFSSRELLVRVETLIQSAALRNKANEHLAQFETLLTRAPLGVYLVDEALRISAVNPVAVPVFGDIPDLVGRDFDHMIHTLWPKPYADEVVQRFRHTLETGEPYHVSEHIEERSDRRATEAYEWEIHRIPLAGGKYGVVCYFRDISKWVAVRETLRDADRRKNEFLATLSHELRNPLAPLHNSLQLLRMNGRLDKSLEPVQKIMERQLNQLTRLVDDLLEISRISRGTLALRKTRVEVATIVRHAVETSTPLISSGGHALSLSLPASPVWVNGDPVRLEQILSNLLNNAALYTDHGGKILVSAHRQGDNVAISVKDNGPGIAAEDKTRIFEMFTRSERSTRHQQRGLGIGLALARTLAQMHDGTLSVISDGPGTGSEFVLALPLIPGHATETSAVPRSELAIIPQQRILVVDDNRDAGDSLASILEVMGGEIRIARSGSEALETFESFRPAAVLLDIGMPGMDGYEVAKRIRADFSQERTVLVALTGWGQEADRAKAKEAGFDHHLVKPAEISALQSVLASIASA